MTETRDSAVTAAELDEFLSQLRGNFWIPGTAREHKAAEVIAALRRERDEAREGCAIWHERYRNSVDDRAKKDAALREISSKAAIAASMCSTEGPAEGFRYLGGIALAALPASQEAPASPAQENNDE